jgi:hypothetical protein
MPQWLATVLGSIVAAAGALSIYALGRQARRKAEKLAERADRRERRREKRERERFERETAEAKAQAEEEDDYDDFLDEVRDSFECGERSFEVEPEDEDRAVRAVEEGRFDHEFRREKMFLYRRGRR